MTDMQNQNATGSVDPLAQFVVDELRKSGTRAWLGFPPEEEMEKFRAEKAERHLQWMKSRDAARKRHHEEMKQAVIRSIRGETDYE
jgi:hypothetical protein